MKITGSYTVFVWCWETEGRIQKYFFSQVSLQPLELHSFFHSCHLALVVSDLMKLSPPGYSGQNKQNMTFYLILYFLDRFIFIR